MVRSAAWIIAPTNPQGLQGYPRCFPGGCDPPYLLARLLAPDALRCRILQLRRVIRPVAPPAFFSQESLLKDTARVVSKVPTHPTSILEESCETSKEAWPATSVQRMSSTRSTEKDDGWPCMERVRTSDPRAIDDGVKFGHAPRTSYSETLVMSTVRQPFKPSELLKALDNLGVPQPEQMASRFESGSDFHTRVPMGAISSSRRPYGSLERDGKFKSCTRTVCGWHRRSPTSIVVPD